MSSPTNNDPTTLDVTALDGLLLVAASAGTGKTWTVTHLAGRWLLETNSDPSELLMVTFSRSAASELCGRLRHHLEEFGEVIENPNATYDGWRSLVAERTLAIGRDAALLRYRHVMSRLDRVHARTIHSFASAIVDVADGTLSDGAELCRRAVNESLARRAKDPELLEIFDLLEETNGSSRTPAAAAFAGRLAQGLRHLEAVGGPRSPRWRLDPGEDADVTSTAAASLLLESYDRYQLIRERERLSTFDSLIVDVHDRTMSDADVIQQLRSQFSLVLIDEFQDTDSLQWDMFSRMFVDEPSPVSTIVVGDPKQAIYGFRGGDVTVFQSVHSALTERGSHVIELSTNFRSSGPVVAAINDLFVRARESQWSFSADEGVAAIGYRPVTAAPSLASRPGYVAIRPVLDDATVTVERDVADVAFELITAGTSPHEIAILCARQSVVRDVQRALERRGIRTVTPLAESVMSTLAAEQVRALLWTLADDGDDRRARLMVATWFHSLGSERVGALRDALHADGVAALARECLSASVLTDVLSDPGAERHWTDLEHVFDLLAGGPDNLLSASAVLRYFDELVANSPGEFETAAQRRIESDSDAVRVMTIHGAKGLQFPIVLVAEIEHAGLTSGRVLSWNENDQRVVDARSLTRTVSFNDASAAYRASQISETRRLIYVALTRAERAMVIWDRKSSTQWRELCTAGAGDALPRYDIADAVASGVIGPSPTASEWRSPSAPDIEPLPVVDESWRRWSYTSLVGDHVDVRSMADGRADDPHAFDGDVLGEIGADTAIEIDDETNDPFASLGGAGFGRAMHRAFELVVGVTPSSDHVTLTDVVQSCLDAEHLANADNIIVVTTALVRLLRYPLGELFGGLCLDDVVATSTTTVEMRFTLALGDDRASTTSRLSDLCDLALEKDPDGPYLSYFESQKRHTRPGQLASGYLNGSIDLVGDVLVDGARHFVIVDYKTNWLSSPLAYSPSSLTTEMSASGYPLQALLYSVALHRHLRGRFRSYDPVAHLGGATYFYVRGAANVSAAPGAGLAEWPIPPELTVAASDLLARAIS